MRRLLLVLPLLVLLLGLLAGGCGDEAGDVAGAADEVVVGLAGEASLAGVVLEKDRELAAALAADVAARARLDAASRARFGGPLEDDAGVLVRLADGRAGLGVPGVRGTSADVPIVGEAGSLKFARAADRWRLDLAATLGLTDPAAAARQAETFAATTPIYLDLAARVESGELADREAARSALTAALLRQALESAQ